MFIRKAFKILKTKQALTAEEQNQRPAPTEPIISVKHETEFSWSNQSMTFFN